MSERTILVWFRNDLRVHDNEILLEATRKADKVLPVYCFDPSYFKVTDAGWPKTGNIRAKFLLESVADLRKHLRDLGGELIIRVGNPAEVITQLAQEYHVNEVYHHREVAFEETAVSEQVEAALWKIKLNLKHFIGHTLYHKEDLPFPIKDIPDSFATFKKKIERDSNVRPAVPSPERIQTPEITDAGELPTLAEFGLEEPVADPRATVEFIGGETEGLKHLHEFISNLGSNAGQKGKNGSNMASYLSPWISLGCLSQKEVYWEVIKHEHGVHSSSHPLVMELFWRDYFRFMFKKHGRQFFKPEGFKNIAPEIAADQDQLFEQWKNGQTGVAFIDAAMHQLNATGYISNYSRQVVASYLVHNLKVDWTRGANYFESKLIDYSPASNWGNWAFVAGVGNDPRENRYFISPKQVAELQVRNSYTDTWLPQTSEQMDAASV